MKNFLAIDTSNDYLTVIGAKDGKIALSHIPDCAMRHSVSFMAEVEKVFAELSLSPSECDFFASTVGAGSFTGIRIGISAVKGFALAFGKPTLPVTSFEVTAYTVLDGAEKILCIIDALHGSYYACGFDKEKRVIFPPAYLSEEEVIALKEEGYALYSFQDLTELGCKKADPVAGFQNAVLALSEEEKFGELVAVYVRKSSAELNLEKGTSV